VLDQKFSAKCNKLTDITNLLAMSAKSVKRVTVDLIFPLKVKFHLAESELPTPKKRTATDAAWPHHE
jgi:hypothetical protein